MSDIYDRLKNQNVTTSRRGFLKLGALKTLEEACEAAAPVVRLVQNPDTESNYARSGFVKKAIDRVTGAKAFKDGSDGRGL